jgi:hypothetical protein
MTCGSTLIALVCTVGRHADLEHKHRPDSEQHSQVVQDSQGTPAPRRLLPSPRPPACRTAGVGPAASQHAPSQISVTRIAG